MDEADTTNSELLVKRVVDGWWWIGDEQKAALVEFAERIVERDPKIEGNSLILACNYFVAGYNRGIRDSIAAMYGRRVCPICGKSGTNVKSECNCHVQIVGPSVEGGNEKQE